MEKALVECFFYLIIISKNTVFLFLNVSAKSYSVWIYVFGRVRAACFLVALAVFYRIIG